jgi:hypothetical protein
VPAGLVLDSAARTITGTATTTGTFDIDLTEALDDSANSERLSELSLEVTAPPPPSAYLVMGATAGRMRDPSNVPAGTNRITFRGKWYWPTGTLAINQKIFSILSLGGDLETHLNNDFRIAVEDGTNAAVIPGSTYAGFEGLAENQWFDIVFDIDQVAQQVTLTINGAEYVIPFAIAGNGLFQTSRPVGFFAVSNGTNPVAAGVRGADLSVEFNGVLHKAISNDPAIANADAWKVGGDFGGAP